MPDLTRGRLNVGHRLLKLCSLALAAIVLFGFALEMGAWRRVERLTPPFSPQGGSAYLAPIGGDLPANWLLQASGDGPGATYSDLQLFVDGHLLGPAHSIHETIRHTGNGAYSHWGSYLIFSIPGGAEPASQLIVVRYSVRLNQVVFLGALALLFIFLHLWFQTIRLVDQGRNSKWLLRISKYRSAIMTFSFGALYYSYVVGSLPHIPLYTYDTPSYINNDPIRSIGYPLFIRLLLWSGMAPFGIVVSQLIIYCVSTIFLSHAIQKLLRTGFLAASVGIIAMAKHGLIYQHYSIGPDSLFAALINITVGITLLLAHRYSVAKVVALVAVLVAMLSVRPAGLGTLPGLACFFVVYYYGFKEKQKAIVSIAAIVVAMAANSALGFAIKGSSSGANLTGLVLIGGNAFLLSPEDQTAEPWIRDELVRQIEPLKRSVETATTFDERYERLLDTYNAVTWNIAYPIALERWLQKYPEFRKYEDAIRSNKHVREAQLIEYGKRRNSAVNAYLLEISKEAIVHHPIGFLKLTAVKIWYQCRHTLLGMWVANPADWFSLNDKILPTEWKETYGYTYDAAENKVGSPFSLFGIETVIGRNTEAVNTLASILTIVCILSYLGLCVRQRHAAPELMVGGAAGLMLGSYSAFVSLVHAPLERYGEPMTTLGLLVIGSAVLWVLRVALNGPALIREAR